MTRRTGGSGSCGRPDGVCKAVADDEREIAELEKEWRSRLGPRKWDQLRALLQEAASSRVSW